MYGDHGATLMTPKAISSRFAPRSIQVRISSDQGIYAICAHNELWSDQLAVYAQALSNAAHTFHTPMQNQLLAPRARCTSNLCRTVLRKPIPVSCGKSATTEDRPSAKRTPWYGNPAFSGMLTPSSLKARRLSGMRLSRQALSMGGTADSISRMENPSSRNAIDARPAGPPPRTQTSAVGKVSM